MSSVEDIRQTQRSQSGVLQSILRRMNSSDELTTARLPADIHLPLQSMNRVEIVEEKLKDSSINQILVSNRFILYAIDFVRAMCQRPLMLVFVGVLLDHVLVLEHSWALNPCPTHLLQNPLALSKEGPTANLVISFYYIVWEYRWKSFWQQLIWNSILDGNLASNSGLLLSMLKSNSKNKLKKLNDHK